MYRDLPASQTCKQPISTSPLDKTQPDMSIETSFVQSLVKYSNAQALKRTKMCGRIITKDNL